MMAMIKQRPYLLEYIFNGKVDREFRFVKPLSRLFALQQPTYSDNVWFGLLVLAAIPFHSSM